jgi:hypothetical protein
MTSTPSNTISAKALYSSIATPKRLQFPEPSVKNDGIRRQSYNYRPNGASKPLPSQHVRATLHPNHSSDSEGESEVSVSKLKGWLDDFGKKQKNHFEKVNKIGLAPADVPLLKPTRPKVQIKEAPRTTKRTTDHVKECRKGPAMTPVRFKPKTDEKVQATDNGYASVKELSAWLAGNPTSKKATRGCVRKGVNVIKKSRMFEKGLEDVIIEEVDLHRGDVDDRRQWLQNDAFRTDRNDDESDFDRQSAVTELVSVQDKKKWLNGAFGDARLVKDDTLMETNGCDSHSAISVTDKREWLKKAFKKGSERMLKAEEKYDPATPAKQKWQAHAKRRSEREIESSSKPSIPASTSKWPITAAKEQPKLQVSSKPTIDQAVTHSIRVANEGISKQTKDESTENEPKLALEPIAVDELPCENNPPQSGTSSPVFDFKAARQLLVQRSAANGNPVKVISKVHTKASRFERMQKEVLKGTGPKGLLRPSWEPVQDRPLGAYNKTFLPNIAPQKTFEDLP